MKVVKKLDKGNGVLLEISCGGWELGSPNPEGRPAPFAMSYMVGREDKRKKEKKKEQCYRTKQKDFEPKSTEK